MKTLIASLSLSLSLMGSAAFAGAQAIDHDRLQNCRGYVELQQGSNGLSLKFDGNIARACSTFTFYDYSSGRMIKSYSPDDGLSGKTYTLSQDQLESLSEDCKLRWRITNPYGGVEESFIITVGECRKKKPQTTYRPSSSGYYCELSNKGNYKLMRKGEYQNKNISASECYGLGGPR